MVLPNRRSWLNTVSGASTVSVEPTTYKRGAHRLQGQHVHGDMGDASVEHGSSEDTIELPLVNDEVPAGRTL